MDLSIDVQADTLAVRVRGRLDLASTPQFERALNAALEEADKSYSAPTTLVVDLDFCDFVSSAGLREFLKAARLMKGRGGAFEIVNVSRDVLEVLRVTGFDRMLAVKPRPREISVEGLEFLASGVCGEVFRLDAESIVKLYRSGIDPKVAEKEKEYARAALVAGIPTAISYDLVRSGDRAGVIYEMLDARQFSTLIRETPQDVDAHARRYAQIVREIHAAPADPAIFPDLKAQFAQVLERARAWLSAPDIDLLKARLTLVPEADTFVHFDIHTSNIMLRDGEPLIIDMGDVSRGSGLFDVGLVSAIYGYPELDICEMVTRIPSDLGMRLWQGFERHYFDGRDQERAFFREHRAFFSCLRALYIIDALPEHRERLIDQLNTVFLPAMRLPAS